MAARPLWTVVPLFLSVLAALALAWLERPLGPQPALSYRALAFDALPGWRDDDHGAALAAFRLSCRHLGEDWREVCALAEETPDAVARSFFEARFVPLRLSLGGDETGKLTGYFEIEVAGSATPDPAHPVPLHRRPGDLVDVDLGLFRPSLKGERIAGRVEGQALKPYATRGEIMNGALRGEGLELLWLADPMEAFFLSVQGSGRVRLADGAVVRVGYAGKNGHVYRSIGAELVARGEIPLESVSMQSIRAWGAANPAKVAELLAANPSYIFFRSVAEPVGALGAPLTPERSLAVDPAFVPLGAPVWLDGTRPDPERGEAPLRRLLVAQDVGSAIRGALRGDVFWGAGERAAFIAGHMNGAASFTLLFPHALARRVVEDEL